MLDSCKFQGFVAKFSRYLPLSGGQRGLSPGPDVLIRGILQVADPQQFGQLLAQGIGRFRAYGYGMLLLKPAMPVQR